MGRPRKKGRGDLPDGLLERPKPSGVYYYFRNPDTGKEVPLGTDRAAAIKGVKLVQRRLAPDPVQQVINAIEKPDATIGEHFAWFLRERVSKMDMTEGSRDILTNRVNKLCRLLGAEKPIGVTTTGMVNDALDEVSAGDRNRYRNIAKDIYRSAVARSLIDFNPAEQTERAVARPKKKRGRLSSEHYWQIHAAAEPWMQRAMEVQRLSLARPGDLCRLGPEHWNGTELKLVVSKSKGKVQLRIFPHKALARALDAAMAHREGDRPKLLTKPSNGRLRGGRAHPCDLSPGILRDEFAGIRDALKLKTTATFYEIKSRGVDDYVELGWSKERIQSLIGHEEVETTELYAEGHGERWERVDLRAKKGKPETFRVH